MKRVLSIALGCALGATAVTAQMKPQQKVMVPSTPSTSPVQITQAQPMNTSVAAAKRITRDEAQKLVKAGKAAYVDVRSKASYDKGHIKGAFSAPRSELMIKIREIPPGMMLITYCACEKELTAAVAVNQLSVHGVKNAAALIGGWNEWIALGLPSEKTK
jgi:rhodanese-related sulfurtransferase